jgi:hypothetical protein
LVGQESTAGELVSLLLDQLASVERVGLDPCLGLAAPDDTELRSTAKKAFIDALMSESSGVLYTIPEPSADSLGGPKR